MRTFICLALLVCLHCMPAVAGDSFPLVLRDSTLFLEAGTRRSTLATTLAGVFSPDELALDIPDRIQYGFLTSDTGGLVTVSLDFDGEGRLLGAIVDSSTREENLPAQELEAWLMANVGPGDPIQDGTRWEYGGFTFDLIIIEDAGEDSMFGFWISRV